MVLGPNYVGLVETHLANKNEMGKYPEVDVSC